MVLLFLHDICFVIFFSSSRVCSDVRRDCDIWVSSCVFVMYILYYVDMQKGILGIYKKQL